MLVSIVIPVLNEYHNLSRLLPKLAAIRGDNFEIIVVDGGSTDGSTKIAKKFANLVVPSDKGRALQQNLGAEKARGERLWFLHADSDLNFAKLRKYLDIICNNNWGRFNVQISGTSPVLSLIARFMNLRSRLTGIATGDQAIFVTKELFLKIGMFKKQKLMEDIELCKALKKTQKPYCASRPEVITSGRKWEQGGIFRTIFLMWLLRLMYFFGASPDDLVKRYYR